MDKIEEALSYKKSLHLYITGLWVQEGCRGGEGMGCAFTTSTINRRALSEPEKNSVLTLQSQHHGRFSWRRCMCARSARR
jgi:hypothetical protein